MSWFTLKDLDPTKKMVKRFLKVFIKIFEKTQSKKVEDCLKHTSDPVVKELLPLYNQLQENATRGYTKRVLKQGGAFLLAMSNIDSAYRPHRNYLLHKIIENKDNIMKALEQERETCDYLNPKDYYDNMYTEVTESTRRKKEMGLIEEDGISTEESFFVDEIDFDRLHKKMRGK